jgi:cytochrome c biogenesis protein CcdA/thiol-disulfide isomerase/thioredoxin
MLILIAFSFLAGIVTILSPCILPVLPIALSGSLGGGKKRPLGVIFGFTLSFTFFTLFLTTIIRVVRIQPDLLRSISIIIIILFGIALILPKFQILLEKFFARLSSLVPNTAGKSGFSGGLLIGISIGLLWTPCVGPILGSVIALAVTGTVTGTALIITLSYSLGTAGPMLAIVYGGRTLLNKIPWLLKNTVNIQRVFGIVMILTGVAIYFNFDRTFQTYILDKFPNYGTGLTNLEVNDLVKEELNKFESGKSLQNKDVGKPMFDVIDDLGAAPEIIPGGEWFNLPSGKKSLKLSELKGKVVLIDFWTYTCINCIRTLPYLKSWHEKYFDDGLVIIGVHTPEFEFEKSSDNVTQAISDFGLKYSIVQDNDYATWRAYKNRYWPAKYLINKGGRIVYTHFGEGAYDETERKIQSLLQESSTLHFEEIDNPTYSIFSRTPEIYLGYARMEFFATPYQIVKDKKYKYNAPGIIPPNSFALTGEWEIGSQFSMPEGGADLTLEFEAKEVFLVMRPKKGSSGEVKVYLDGEIAENSSDGITGEDVDSGVIFVDSDRLYKLIKLESAGRHNLKLEFLDSNVEIYAFTFG